MIRIIIYCLIDIIVLQIKLWHNACTITLHNTRGPMKRFNKTTLEIITLLVFVGPIALQNQSLAAGSFTVNTTTDTHDALTGNGTCADSEGKCSLRAAVEESRGSSSSVITLPAGSGPYTISSSLIFDGTIILKGNNVVLKGTGATLIKVMPSRTVTINALIIQDAPLDNTAYGVVHNEGTLTLSRVTIKNGQTRAIYNKGSLSLRQSLIDSNHSVGGGGAIRNEISTAMLSVTGSTLRNNSSDDSGGALWSLGGSTFTASTLSGNTATLDGGAIYNQGSTTLTSVTISDNHANHHGGALFNAGAFGSIRSATITNNSANIAGGIYRSSGTVTLKNSILAVNTDASTDGTAELKGLMTSQGYNLIGSIATCLANANCLIDGAAPGDIINANPQLNALADNGGGTDTHLPQAGSLAINAGSPNASGSTACLTRDQRNQPRNLTCDIGAVETPCGNGVTNPDEACDDGNTSNDDDCSNACSVPVCGDGILKTGEQCDDGNTIDNDTCTNACTTPVCGDGIVNAAEQCDDGNVDNLTCTDTCHLASCGDGIKTVAEQCDDGNAINNDDCTNTCTTPVCGDGITNAGEVCDDGNAVNDDACNNLCHAASCGDGILQAGLEQCEDGNTINDDACSNTCHTPSCGDGILQAGEECDDGNSLDGDACSSACRTSVTDSNPNVGDDSGTPAIPPNHEGDPIVPPPTEGPGIGDDEGGTGTTGGNSSSDSAGDSSGASSGGCSLQLSH